jgi:uncharacterized repeat protein (TIGR01451 family)
MSRMNLISRMVVGLLTTAAATAHGQLPSLPPSLPKPSSTAEQPALSVPPALSGVKAGQSETAVLVSNPTGGGLPGAPLANGAAAIPAPVAPGASPFTLNPAAGMNSTGTGPVASMIPSSAEETGAALAAGSGLESAVDQGRTNALLSPGPTGATADMPKLTATTNGREIPARANPPRVEPSDSPAERTSFKTLGATIQVETIGPRSIAVNKPSEFEIRVTNSGSQAAQGITVEANFPAFVDLTMAQPSGGAFDQQNGAAEPRLKWRLESIPAGGSATAVLQVVPRQAMLFDFQVQWVAEPMRGQSAVQVTEPKLDMRIAGPAEVQYGETAIYTVSIRNPGTGIAEGVEIMLSEDLGGQRATVGNILPGDERTFEVELIPGEAGTLSLQAFAKADTIEHSASKEIIVRRADLELILDGPPAVYAGTPATYRIIVKNTGDAIARDVVAAAVLPPGAKYVGGIDAAEVVQSGLRWNLGNLPIGEERRYEIKCVYQQAGDLRLEAGVRAADDLAATHLVNTAVSALADLVLAVESPKGPLPIKEQVNYVVRIKNRGTSAGKNIQLAMQFSEGIEPVGASGVAYDIEPGQITFRPIENLEIDQEIAIRVQAVADVAGNHRFRAVMTCDDPVSEEIAQGTTRFYGHEIHAAGASEIRRSAEAESGLRR